MRIFNQGRIGLEFFCILQLALSEVVIVLFLRHGGLVFQFLCTGDQAVPCINAELTDGICDELDDVKRVYAYFGIRETVTCNLGEAAPHVSAKELNLLADEQGIAHEIIMEGLIGCLVKDIQYAAIIRICDNAVVFFRDEPFGLRVISPGLTVKLIDSECHRQGLRFV